MANDYGIVTSAWGKKDDELHLSEGVISIKIQGDTEFKNPGYCGDITFSNANDYKKFDYGIPKRTIASKKIKQTGTLKFKIFQVESNKIAFGSGAYIDNATVTDSTRAIFRSKDIQPLECSILIQSDTNDGRALDLYIRKGIITPESTELLFNSDDWNGLEINVDVVPDEAPLETNFSWPLLNAVETTGTATTATSEITVVSATGVSVGDYVYDSTGYLGEVTEIDSLDITIDETLDHAIDALTAVKFIDPDVINEDDIAFVQEKKIPS